MRCCCCRACVRSCCHFESAGAVVAVAATPAQTGGYFDKFWTLHTTRTRILCCALDSVTTLTHSHAHAHCTEHGNHFDTSLSQFNANNHDDDVHGASVVVAKLSHRAPQPQHRSQPGSVGAPAQLYIVQRRSCTDQFWAKLGRTGIAGPRVHEATAGRAAGLQAGIWLSIPCIPNTRPKSMATMQTCFASTSVPVLSATAELERTIFVNKHMTVQTCRIYYSFS